MTASRAQLDARLRILAKVGILDEGMVNNPDGRGKRWHLDGPAIRGIDRWFRTGEVDLNDLAEFVDKMIAVVSWTASPAGVSSTGSPPALRPRRTPSG